MQNRHLRFLCFPSTGSHSSLQHAGSSHGHVQAPDAQGQCWHPHGLAFWGSGVTHSAGTNGWSLAWWVSALAVHCRDLWSFTKGRALCSAGRRYGWTARVWKAPQATVVQPGPRTCFPGRAIKNWAGLCVLSSTHTHSIVTAHHILLVSIGQGI